MKNHGTALPVPGLGCNIYKLIVDYDRSVENGVLAGRYDWFTPDIVSRNFPTALTGKSKVTVELICFDRKISEDETLRELDKLGYRAANLHELLAFGEKYHDVQRKFPVVALGSVWQDPDGGRSAPCLIMADSKRVLYLCWIKYGWFSICRFAAVRK